MIRLKSSIVIALSLSLLASAFVQKPTFAGWVRVSRTGLMVRDGAAAKPVNVKAGQAQGFRLFSGQQVKAGGPGNASLLIYGHAKDLAPAEGWFTIPTDRTAAPRGRDEYAKYTTPGGRARGDEFDEQVWRALTLKELTNPNPSPKARVEIRVRKLTAAGKSGAIVPQGGKVGLDTKLVIEVRNLGTASLYMSVIDIDCAANILRIFPVSGNGKPIRPHSNWVRLPQTLSLALPDGWIAGSETFKLIGSTRPLNLTVLETSRIKTSSLETKPALDSLVYLIQNATQSKSPINPGAWSAAATTFTIVDKP